MSTLKAVDKYSILKIWRMKQAAVGLFIDQPAHRDVMICAFCAACGGTLP